MAANTRAARGTTLIETMVSIAVLAIAALGLVGGVILALKTNALASRRTQMKEFAQTRIDRFIQMRPQRIPTGTLGWVNYDSRMDVGSTFDPAGSTGWVLDDLDNNGLAVVDLLAGPAMVDPTGMTAGDDLAGRTATLNAAVAGQTCAVASVVNDPQALCREIHVDATTTSSGIPILRAYVRVTLGGSNDTLILQQDLSQ